MKPTMIDCKDASTIPAADAPTYIDTSACEKDETLQKRGVTKRRVIYAISAVVVIAIILLAIIVGVYMFTKTQKEITEFALQFKGRNNEDINLDVKSDPNDNVVQYHVTKNGQDAYIVNDFNRGMQVVKVAANYESVCYVTALNRSAFDDPSVITGPDKVMNREGNKTYTAYSDAVVDRTFLPKKALDLCRDVSLYWVVRRCDSEKESDVKEERVRRTSRCKICVWLIGCFWC